MSPSSCPQPPVPTAAALADRAALTIGAALRDERRRRWSVREVARRAWVSDATVINVESGRRASLETHARLTVALGLDLEIVLGGRHRRAATASSDLVHASMGEYEAQRLARPEHRVEIDWPYQHYQFAGRADVVAWTRDPLALLHIENRTRFPDIQAVAASYNAKRQYLAADVARRAGLRRFESETHVIAGLWSAEVIHSVRLRPATFRVLCPDPDDRLAAWLLGSPPADGRSSSFVLLDPLAGGRQAATAGLDRVLGGAKPRMRDYRDAAARLRSAERLAPPSATATPPSAGEAVLGCEAVLGLTSARQRRR